MADNNTGPHTWGPEDRIVGGNILRPSDNSLFSLPRGEAAAFSGLYNFKIKSEGEEVDEVVPVASQDMKPRWLQYDAETVNANERAARVVRAAADIIKTWYMRGEILKIPEPAYKSMLRLFFPSFFAGGHIGSLEFSGGMVFSSTGESGEGTYGYMAGDSIYPAYTVQSPQPHYIGLVGSGYSTLNPALYVGLANYGNGGYATANIQGGGSFVGRSAVICPHGALVSLPIAHTSPVFSVALRYSVVKSAFVHTVAYAGLASSSRPVSGTTDVEYLYAYNNGQGIVYATDRFSASMQASNNVVPVSVVDTYEKEVPYYAVGHEVPAIIEVDTDPYAIPEVVRQGNIGCVCKFDVMGRHYELSGRIILDTGVLETWAYGSAEATDEPVFGILHIEEGKLNLAADTTAAVLLETKEETVTTANDSYYFKAAKKIAVNLSVFLNTHAKRICVTNATDEVKAKVAQRSAEGTLHSYSGKNRSALLSRGMYRTLVGVQAVSPTLGGEFEYITTGAYSVFSLGKDCSTYAKVGSRIVGSGAAVQYLPQYPQDIYPSVYRKECCPFITAGDKVNPPLAYSAAHRMAVYGSDLPVLLKPSSSSAMSASLIDRGEFGTPFGYNYTSSKILTTPAEHHSLFGLFEYDSSARLAHQGPLHAAAVQRVIGGFSPHMYLPILVRGASECTLTLEEEQSIFLKDGVSFTTEAAQAFSVAFDSRLGTLIATDRTVSLTLPETSTAGAVPGGGFNPSTAVTFVTTPTRLAYSIVSTTGAEVVIGSAGCSAHIAPLATAAESTYETPSFFPDSPFSVTLPGTRSRVVYEGMAADPLSYGLLAYAGQGTVRATPSGKVVAIDLGAVIREGTEIFTSVEVSDRITVEGYANRLSAWLAYPCPYYSTRYSLSGVAVDTSLVLTQVEAIPTSHDSFTLIGRGGIVRSSDTIGTYKTYRIHNYLAVNPLDSRNVSANTYVVTVSHLNNYELQVERLQRCAGRTRRFLYTVVQGWVDDSMLLHIQKRGPTQFIDVSFPIPAYGAVAATSFASTGVYDVRNGEDNTTRMVTGEVSCVETLHLFPSMAQTVAGIENRYSQIYDGKERCVVVMLASSDPTFSGEFCAVVPSSLYAMVQTLAAGVKNYDMLLEIVRENIGYMEEMNRMADEDQTTLLLQGWSYAGIEYLRAVEKGVGDDKEHADMQEIPFDFPTSLAKHLVLKAWDIARIVLNDFVSKRLFVDLLTRSIMGGIITTTKDKAKENIVMLVYSPVPRTIP